MTAQAFWDKQAPKYAKKPIADIDAYEEKLQSVTALLSPTDRVLEIGCGTGGTARRIAPSVAHVTGTDISAEMIRIARSRTSGYDGGKPDYIQADAAQTIGGAPFDAICAFSLLHLVNDLPGVLAAVFDQLKPGGYFFSKTICLKDAPFWMPAIVRMLMTARVAPEVSIISRTELIEQLKQAGFEINQTKFFGKKRTSPFIVARRPLS